MNRNFARFALSILGLGVICITTAAPASAERFRAWDGPGTHLTRLVDDWGSGDINVADDRVESVWNERYSYVTGRSYTGLWSFSSQAGQFAPNTLYKYIDHPNQIDFFESGLTF
ncbi:hypothetical protein GCM10009595_09520 [Falsarthrobacter nasiphocae]